MAYVGVDGVGDLQIVDDPAQVPGYRTVVSSAESLALVTDVASMDALRSRMVGLEVVRSRTIEQAAERLWYLVELYSVGRATGATRMPQVHRGVDSSRVEMVKLNYTRGCHWMRDKLYDKLAQQSKTIMQILEEDGRMVWSEQAVRGMMADNQQRFNTKRPCLEIYNYYRSRLMDAGYLKKLSYAEFATSVAFPGTSAQTGT